MPLARLDEVRLSLPGDQHVIVKAELNYGETIAMYAAMRRAEGDVDPLKVGPALVAAYLLDWSLTDNDGRILSVRQQPPDVIASALHHLPYDDGQDVVTAIRTHDDAITAAREEKKTRRAGPTPSAPSLRSLAAVGGGMSGSGN